MEGRRRPHGRSDPAWRSARGRPLGRPPAPPRSRPGRGRGRKRAVQCPVRGQERGLAGAVTSARLCCGSPADLGAWHRPMRVPPGHNHTSPVPTTVKSAVLLPSLPSSASTSGCPGAARPARSRAPAHRPPAFHAQLPAWREEPSLRPPGEAEALASAQRLTRRLLSAARVLKAAPVAARHTPTPTPGPVLGWHLLGFWFLLL